MNKLDSMVDAVPLETYRAAQNTLESAQHIHQQRQQSICPICNGTGHHLIEGTDHVAECVVCKGTGKRLAVA